MHRYPIEYNLQRTPIARENIIDKLTNIVLTNSIHKIEKFFCDHNHQELSEIKSMCPQEFNEMLIMSYLITEQYSDQLDKQLKIIYIQSNLLLYTRNQQEYILIIQKTAENINNFFNNNNRQKIIDTIINDFYIFFLFCENIDLNPEPYTTQLNKLIKTKEIFNKSYIR